MSGFLRRHWAGLSLIAFYVAAMIYLAVANGVR